jgi:hypothetical protein
MMRVAVVSLILSMVAAASARAQDLPPKIGPFVLDVRGVVPRFPADANLAESRDVTLAELPGGGLGIQIGAHVYPLRWRSTTFGIGGELVRSRARRSPAAGQGAAVRATEEKFTSLAPQLSFNFGTGRGWSYVSGGIARSTWSLVPGGRKPFPTDSDKLKTINYGGGARWFARPHVAFTFDLRFYAINPGAPYLTFPSSPRTRLMVIGAGVSIK